MRLYGTFALGDVAGTGTAGVAVGVVAGAWLCVVHWVVEARIVGCGYSYSSSKVEVRGRQVEQVEHGVEANGPDVSASWGSP